MKNYFREKIYSINHFFELKHRNRINRKFTKSQRKRLKNDNFTIISSNCIGGVIYHRLGKEINSPTINLRFYQNEFIKYAQDLNYYLGLKLLFIESDREYPVALLGDIRIFFLHYSSEKEAEMAWERRKRRVNYDNLYLIMYDKDDLTDDDYQKFSKIHCKNRIILSDVDNFQYPFFKKIKKNNQLDKVYLECNKYGIMTFERQWDYVDWLNT